MKLSKTHMALLIIGTIIGLFFTASSFIYAFYGWIWWIPSESASGRQFMIGFYHIFGMILTIISSVIWFIMGLTTEQRKALSC